MYLLDIGTAVGTVYLLNIGTVFGAVYLLNFVGTLELSLEFELLVIIDQ